MARGQSASTGQQAAPPPRAPGRARASGAAKKVASGAAKGAKVAGKVGKVAGNVILPAAGLATKELRTGFSGTRRLAVATQALMQGRPGSLGTLATVGGKAAYSLSTAALPIAAGLYAGSAALDAYKKGKGVAGAAEEGAYTGGDFILGGAMSTYAERRRAGDGKVEATVRATLAGMDKRFLFGLGQSIKDKFTKAMSISDQNAQFARNYDPASTIASHGDNGAYGVKDPSKLTDPKYMTPGDKEKLSDAKREQPRVVFPVKPQQSSAAGQKPGATGGPRGWANPTVQAAAQEARAAKLGTKLA